GSRCCAGSAREPVGTPKRSERAARGRDEQATGRPPRASNGDGRVQGKHPEAPARARGTERGGDGGEGEGGGGGGGGGGRGRAPCDRSAAPTNQPARRPRAGNRANAPNPMPGSQKPVRAPACKSCLGGTISSSMQRRQLGASSPPPCGRGGVRPP
ncbi:unnamed protein product, partial [Prorocentrum cordatum]